MDFITDASKYKIGKYTPLTRIPIFSDNKIKENYDKLIETINKEKPNGIIGNFILSAFLTSTMGISYRIKLGK